MIFYDVHIKSTWSDEPFVKRIRAKDPDDAIYRCEQLLFLLPEAGDRVVRCVPAFPTQQQDARE